ncbi:MAG: GNAT family N-acetyltransferase [Bacteroidota bacterium]
MKLDIIRAVEADIPALIHWRKDALKLAPEAFGASAAEGVDETWMRAVMGLPNSPVRHDIWMAMVEGELAGAVGMVGNKRIKQAHKGNIWGMFVYPKWRGEGIGRLLLEKCIEEGKADPALEQVHLSVIEGEGPAFRLYRRLGFEPYGREPRGFKIGDRYLDLIYLALRL